jgi:hypothetical protein
LKISSLRSRWMKSTTCRRQFLGHVRRLHRQGSRARGRRRWRGSRPGRYRQRQANRVMHLAGAVGGDDHHRRRRGADGAVSGTVSWKSASSSSERLERLVGAVEPRRSAARPAAAPGRSPRAAAGARGTRGRRCRTTAPTGRCRRRPRRCRIATVGWRA